MLAAFPPGSVTGAPEGPGDADHRRARARSGGAPTAAPSAGSTTPASAVLNVAIRTITATGTPLEAAPDETRRPTSTTHAGCGIVAESDPEAEYRESLDKTEVFRRAIENASFASTNR